VARGLHPDLCLSGGVRRWHRRRWLLVVDYRQRRRRLAPRGCFWRRNVLAHNCGPNGLVRNWRRSLVARNCGPNGLARNWRRSLVFRNCGPNDLVRNWRWSLLVRNCGPRGEVYNCATFAMGWQHLIACVTDIASPIACRVRYSCCRLGRPLPGAFAGGGNLIYFWLRRFCVGCPCFPSSLRRPVRS